MLINKLLMGHKAKKVLPSIVNDHIAKSFQSIFKKSSGILAVGLEIFRRSHHLKNKGGQLDYSLSNPHAGKHNTKQ